MNQNHPYALSFESIFLVHGEEAAVISPKKGRYIFLVVDVIYQQAIRFCSILLLNHHLFLMLSKYFYGFKADISFVILNRCASRQFDPKTCYKIEHFHLILQSRVN